MLRNLSLTCLLAFVAHFSYAQTAAQPGYIVTLAGDTTRGILANQAGARAAQSCRFQPTAQAEFTSFTPAQLRAYGTAAYAYRTYVVGIEGAAPEPRFLAVVEQGPVSLLLLIDSGGHERYFISKGASEAVELRQVVRARPDLPGNIVETNNLYRIELERAFQDCPVAQRRVHQASFNLLALRRVVQLYNTCRQPATAVRPLTQPGQSRLRLSAVYSLPVYTTFRLGDGQGRVPADDKLRGGYYLTAGLLLSLGGHYHNNHLSLVTGLLTEINRAYSTQRVYPNLSYDPLYQHSQLDVSLSYLKLPLLARYSWSGTAVRPYVEAGLYVRALLSVPRNTVTDTYAAGQPTTSRTYALLATSQNITPAPTIGAGFRLGAPDRRCLTLGAQAELASGPQLVSNPLHYSYSSQLISVSALVAYDLTK